MTSNVKIVSGKGEVDPSRKSKAIRLAENKRARIKRVSGEAWHRVSSIASMLQDAMDGDLVAGARLKEAVATGDFPLLFNQLLDQGMLAQYAGLPSVWPQYSSRITVNDFRPQRLMQWYRDQQMAPEQNGGQPTGQLALPRVPELSEYPTFTLKAEEQSYGIAKYGERFPFSFEVFRNDEFQVIRDLPGVMARTAADTEDVVSTQVLAAPTGPNPDFFDTTTDFGPLVPPGNYVANNPPLSVESLQAAIEQIGNRRLNDNPVTVPNFTLVVPPALEFTARRIAAVSQIEQIVGGFDPTTNRTDNVQQRVVFPNLVAGRFSVTVNPWLPLVDASATSATTWYLVPSGGTDGTRRAIVTVFLAGEETPDLRINNDTGNAITGGQVDPFRGSFSHDDVQFRVRHIIGAAGLNKAPVAVSKGNDEATTS